MLPLVIFIGWHPEKMSVWTIRLHTFCIQILLGATEGKTEWRQSFPDGIRNVRECLNWRFEPGLLNLIEWTWIKKANVLKSTENTETNMMQFYLSLKSRNASGFTIIMQSDGYHSGKRRDFIFREGCEFSIALFLKKCILFWNN